MKLYHYTSLENFTKITNDCTVKPLSSYNGIQGVWLTANDKMHHQHWARGTDKAQIRLTINTLNYIKFRYPEGEERFDLFRLGADDWYFATAPLPSVTWVKMDVFSPSLRRYVSYARIFKRALYYNFSYWYEVRWSKEEENHKNIKKDEEIKDKST